MLHLRAASTSTQCPDVGSVLRSTIFSHGSSMSCINQRAALLHWHVPSSVPAAEWEFCLCVHAAALLQQQPSLLHALAVLLFLAAACCAAPVQLAGSHLHKLHTCARQTARGMMSSESTPVLSISLQSVPNTLRMASGVLTLQPARSESGQSGWHSKLTAA